MTASAITVGPDCHFFGYYDKCPWDAAGQRILVHRAAFDGRPPTADDRATIGVVHLAEDNRFQAIGETPAWNFQQGAMLQWVGPDFSRRVVFNQRKGDRFTATLVDLVTGDTRELPRPVSTITHDGRYALSLNYARLADTRPGYGYAGVVDPWADDDCPEDDGIYLMNLESGEARLILSVAQVRRSGGGLDESKGKHWLNVVYFNPSDRRFCFLHRWRSGEGPIRTRLFTANLDGSDLFCLCDSGMISHFDWRNDVELLAWARKGGSAESSGRNKKRKMLPPTDLSLYKRPPFSSIISMARRAGVLGLVRQKVYGDRFVLFKDQTPEMREMGLDVLKEDGHCSFSPDGRWVLMDSYPHEDHRRTLLVYSPDHQKRIDLGRFYSVPKLTGEIRCDLHARWSRDGKQVCIDSSHEGGCRQVYVIDVESALRKGGQ